MRRWRPPRGRVLVLAPHPDDETLGCGGALLLHARRGDPVRVAFATDGERGGPSSARKGLAARRRREAREAARVLGIRELEHWGEPDGGLRGSRGLARLVKAALLRARPEVLYRPASDDPHPDHAALGRAVERALADLPERPLDCRYEVWSAPKPNAVLDISRDFARKARALAAYRSQRPALDLLPMARRLNAGRGLLLGSARYAEGFRLPESAPASSARSRRPNASSPKRSARSRAAAESRSSGKRPPAAAAVRRSSPSQVR